MGKSLRKEKFNYESFYIYLLTNLSSIHISINTHLSLIGYLESRNDINQQNSRNCFRTNFFNKCKKNMDFGCVSYNFLESSNSHFIDLSFKIGVISMYLKKFLWVKSWQEFNITWHILRSLQVLYLLVLIVNPGH